MLRLACCLLFLLNTSCLFGQIDNIGSGRAIRFDGVDDYVDLGNVFDDLVLPFTVSAWVYIDPATTGAFPILVSQDNDPIYNGFWFFISPTALWIEYGDGLGENLPLYRRGKSANLENITGRWINVCAVVKGMYDIDLYLNGVNVGGSTTGDSSLPMASVYPNDVAKIGYFLSNGVTYRFKGIMDELRVWKRALSETQVRENMCKKVAANDVGLIGYWSFNETSGLLTTDKSANSYNGQLKGNPSRVFSGAPIGDESTSLYTNSWSGKSVKLGDIEANNILGNPEGVHVFKVNDVPSRTNGLDLGLINNPYYGVFISSLDKGNLFDLKGASDILCKAFARYDNSEIPWTELKVFTSVPDRKEVIPFTAKPLADIDLGADKLVCDQVHYSLDTHITDLADKSILWSNGQTSKSIDVTQSGIYSVKVSTSCGMQQDTVKVDFLKKPTSFNLGVDEELCVIAPKLLRPYIDGGAAGFEFQWQDGSHEETFKVDDFGSYWVVIKNACGIVSDTLKLTKLQADLQEIPNIITPNDDPLNQHFIISSEESVPNRLVLYNRWGTEVYSTNDYKNNWDGAGLPSGVYYYQLSGNCVGEKRGSITISR